MLAVTHLLVALVIIDLFRLDRNNAIAVLLFGVLIDLDHVIGLAIFVSQDGWSHVLDANAMMASDVQWKGFLHEPAAAFLVAPCAIGFKHALPFAAWAIHLLMDHVQQAYLGVASIPEIILFAALAAFLVKMERDELAVRGRLTLRGAWERQVSRFMDVRPTADSA